MKTMKTIFNIKKVLLVATILLTVNTIHAQRAEQVHMGLRLPQMTDAERTKIGAEKHATQARGQMIFSKETETLQYWNGDSWILIESKDSIYSFIVNNLASDTTFLQNLITNLISDTTFIEGLTSNEYFLYELVENMFNHQEIINMFIDSLTTNEYFINNISLTDELKKEILNYIENNVTQKLTDSIMSKVTIEGKHGIEIERKDPSNIIVKMPEGKADNEIMIWDNTAKKWVVSEQNTKVRQVTIPVEDGKFSTEQLIFHGKTTDGLNLKVVSVEPIFTGHPAIRRTHLKVDALVEADGNAALWTISIDNRNFNPQVEFVLQSVVISYISESKTELANFSQEVVEIIGY